MFSVAVPRVLLPFMNVTVPVALAGVTVAVKVTDCPALDGFSEEVSVVVLAVLLTVWVSGAEVLLANVASPG